MKVESAMNGGKSHFPFPAARSALPGDAERRGFTLIELLVVIAVIGILTGVLLPSLARAKDKARAIECLSNKRQLQLAWLLYPGDNEDRLVPHGLNVPSPPQPELNLWWAQGFLNYDGGNSENTSTALLLDPKYAQLGAYTENAAIYKCPSDRSQVKVGRSGSAPRVRSISMNAFTGGQGQCGTARTVRFGPQTFSAIINPSRLFVFIDEHPDSLDFVSFWVEDRKRAAGSTGSSGSCPSSLHSGGAAISFADGHVELHKWIDARTKPRVTYSERLSFQFYGSDNPDVRWLQERIQFEP